MQGGRIIKSILFLLLVSVVVLPAYCDAGSAFEKVPEEILLMDYSQSVFKPDPYTLCFALSSGDTLCFSDYSSRDITRFMALHTLCSFLPEQNYWTMDVFGFEYSVFVLINGDSGWRTLSVSPPVPSPDGGRLLCARSPSFQGFYEGGMQIFRVSGDSLVTEFSVCVMYWAPENVSWLSDSTIVYYKSSLFSEDGDGVERGTLTLTGDGSWVADNPDHFTEEPFRDEISLFPEIRELYIGEN